MVKLLVFSDKSLETNLQFNFRFYNQQYIYIISNLLMKVLDYNDQFLLMVSDQKTVLMKCPKLTIVSEVSGGFRLGSLQYSTGIAALGASSQVCFYDFKYQRKIQQIQTILKLRKLKIIKNLLFCVSQQRILIYDIATKTNLCHIPTSNGNVVAINSDYYNLRLLYPASGTIYHEQQIWTNQTKKFQFGKAQLIEYDHSGEIVCTAQDNVLALFQGQQMVRGCSFDDKVVQIRPSSSPRRFYIHTLNQKDPTKELFLQVSPIGKTYLKLSEQYIEGNISDKTSEISLLFQHKGLLLVWKGDKVYKTEVDTDPNIGQQNRQIKEEEIKASVEKIDMQ